MRFDVLICALVLAPVAAIAAPRFESVPVPEHSYEGGWEHFVGGGVAAFDCDADHLPDLFVAGGTSPAALLRNRSAKNGPLSFQMQTPDALALTGVIGAYPLDIDADGWLDLAVLRVGPNLLLRGGADCTFSRFEGLEFESGDHWTTAFSATWEPDQNLPTLAFGNYVDRDAPSGPFRSCDKNNLYRPDGGRYPAPLPLLPGRCPLSILFSDWSRTGRADLRLSNDRHYYVDEGEEQMWQMGKSPVLLGKEDGWISHKLWGMGIASRDLTGDGRPEVFLTSMGDQRLQKRTAESTPTYEDVPFDLGTTAHRPYLGGDGRPSTGWHAAFGDVQNDGRDDLFIAKGNVEQMPDAAMDDPNNLLVQMPDGTFTETGEQAGVASLYRARGAALVDLNADGRLDLVVVNRRAPLEIWQNTTQATGNWLSVALLQGGGNARAVGAFVEVETLERVYVQENTVGGGHAGGDAVPMHFGLGAVEDVRLRVIWPDGTASRWLDTPANKRLAITRTDNGPKMTFY